MLLHSYIDPERGFFSIQRYMTPKSLRLRYANTQPSHLMCVMIEFSMCFLFGRSHGSYHDS